MNAARPAARLLLADAAAVAGLLLLTSVYAARFVGLGPHPEEDAAMLLRYSSHLASGQGIVWNPGEAPVDGATDFLFMLLAAALRTSGLSLEASARGLGLVAHAVTVAVVYLAGRRLFSAPPALCLLPAVYLAAGPGLRYVAAAYGTTLFALTVAAAWWSAHALLEERDRGKIVRRARWLGALGLTMGVARPEGAFLAVFFLAAVVWARRGERAAVLRGFLTVFLPLGLAYLAWRFHYFGHPLPNPFYRKGGGVLHWDVLLRSLRNVGRLAGPFLAVLGGGLFLPRTRRLALFALLPTAAFAALWVLVSDETNYFMRFRYPILPAILVTSIGVGAGLLAAVSSPELRAAWRPAGAAAASVLAVALVVWQHHRFRHIAPRRMGLQEVAVALSEYAGRGYTLATTEAGLLPLYSRWKAVDAWGLNDAWIAHAGGITEEYLDRHRPELVVFHAYFSPGTPETGPEVEERGLGPEWHRMVLTLKTYAERRAYHLAAVFGKGPHETHYYYVKPGFPESAAIVDRIRRTEYFWDGAPTANYAPP